MFAPFCSRTGSPDDGKGCEEDADKVFIDEFLDYIGGRIRQENDTVRQLQIANIIQKALFESEMDLAKRNCHKVE